jgi:hypothetical protein
MLTLDESLANPLIEIAEATLIASRTEIELPTLQRENDESADPHRIKCLIDSDEPKYTWSQIDKVLPKLPIENNDIADPILTYWRSENAEPKFAVLRTLKQLDNLIKDRTDIVDEHSKFERTDTASPASTFLMIDSVDPNRANCLTERLLPNESHWLRRDKAEPIVHAENTERALPNRTTLRKDNDDPHIV